MGEAIRQENRVYGMGETANVLVETLFDAHGAIVEQRVKIKEGYGARWSGALPRSGSVERFVFDRRGGADL
jgi:hypothetical protein